jgi:purine-binding chemotaxis protein CheW
MQYPRQFTVPDRSESEGSKFVNATDDPNTDVSLLCRLQTRLCALPLGLVVETMRPLPVEPVSGTPDFVLGLAIIRGAPVPVVDATRLLGGETETPPARFVTLRLGDRRVALAVDAVVGVRALHAASLEALPPLLRDATADVVSAIGSLDEQLLLVLRNARLVPERLWSSLESGGSP